MGMRDIMARLREEDPDMARWVARIRFVTTAIAVVACIALIAAVGSNVWNWGQDKNITNVHNEVTRFEKSACAKDPTHPSEECEEIRRKVDRYESIVGACIIHQRVTGEKGRNCPRLFVDIANEGAPESRPSDVSPRGGDASQSPTSATQQPAPGSPAQPKVSPGGSTKTAPPPRDGSSSPGTSGGHSDGAPDNPSSSAPSSSPGSSSSSTTVIERTTPAAPTSPSSPAEPVAPVAPERVVPTLGEVVGSVGTTVEEVGATATGTVEGVTSKACEATGLLCSK